MKLYKVGILGATGAVGREMMKILAERQFPISELRLFASSRSAGKVVEWNGRPVMIQEPSEENFRGLDIVLGAAESDIARLYAPEVVRAGAVFVDNSSAYRMDDDVPLVIPEVNPEDVKLHHGIIASANCSTIITVTAVNALNAISPIRSMVVVSKWLSISPRILLLDEPTQGIDVGAKADIYQLIDRLAREGMGVIVVSSDLIEIINLSNRIVVMRDGQAIKTLESDELTEENVMLYAMGVNADEKA